MLNCSKRRGVAMLLNYKFSNFRSFCEESVLDMKPANIRDIPYSILCEQANKEYKALSSAVIYGANASGKSNAILVLAFLKELVIAGNIKNQRCIPVGLIPCFCNNNEEPISFSIEFINKGYHIDYTVKIGGASFLSDNLSEMHVEFESLTVNGQHIFERQSDKIIHLFLNESLENNTKTMLLNKAESSMLSDELFLSNGFKTLGDTNLYSIILDWFKDKLVIVRNIDYISATPKFDYEHIEDANEGECRISDTIINKIAKEAGINYSEIHFVQDEKEKKPKQISVIDGKGVIARFIESSGTMKIVNFLPLVISVMIKGGTLIVDELDSSLHPSAVFSIINAFHNDELNTRKAQLIFTSHNPIYQKAKIFRRDEIKFIERNECTSRLYSLSDFGTSGESSVKNSTDIMKNYLTGKYGAVNYVDFSDVIREAIFLNNCKEG